MKPNFFIAGAAKCGTTSLYEYIRTHPDVYMCNPKEPFFWSKDLPFHQKMKTLEGYLQLFETAQAQVVGEASPYYVYSDAALADIKAFAPFAKLVVMFRNPVEQIQSMHSQMLYSGIEEVTDFRTAWDLQQKRSIGTDLPSDCIAPQLLQYKDVASFGFQLSRLYEHFDKSQVHVVLFHDLKSNPETVYKEVVTFLDLKTPNHLPDFDVANRNKAFRNQRIGRWLRHPPSVIRKVGRAITRTTGFSFGNVLRRSFTKRTERVPIDPEFRKTLNDAFQSDVELLGNLLSKDLQKKWLQ